MSSPLVFKQKMSTINSSDEEAVAKRFSEFKEMLILLGKLKEKDPVNDDVLLMRFLRARQYSIPLATQMFTECEEWREKMDVDSLVNSYTFEENELVSKIYPRCYVRNLMGYRYDLIQLISIKLIELEGVFISNDYAT
jgi:hypothetical protein